jgi:hypothetical protein
MQRKKQTKLQWLRALYGLDKPADAGGAAAGETAAPERAAETLLVDGSHVLTENYWEEVEGAVEQDDMVAWAQALDFDQYTSAWGLIGTTRPADEAQPQGYE